MTPDTGRHYGSNLRGRKIRAAIFQGLCVGLAALSILILAVLLYHVGRKGLSWLDWDFLNNPASTTPEDSGVYAALWGSIWLALITAAIAIPVGVSAAIYLEEYSRKNRFTAFIDINVANLAGVPSVIYGVLGLAVFVPYVAKGENLLAGGCTMALLVLPVIIIASRESIRAVPQSIRLAAYAIGATRWQTVRAHVLPAALPGIMTGLILAMSRSIGETAPLILTGAVGYIFTAPDSWWDSYTVLPLQIFEWTSRPRVEFQEVAAAAIMVLLVVLLLMNAIAVFIRHKFQRVN